MPTFLDSLTIYNAKAAAAITQAVSEGDTPKANLMSSLKTTANDATLPEAIRLTSLTALINVGNLLDVPLPPYFPVSVAYADSVTYVGLHDNLSGLQGGAPGEYYHLTATERADILGKVSPSELQFANLTDSPYANALLGSALNGKQDVLSGPVGTSFVKINGTTISYDTSTYLTAVSGPAGGDLSGTYPNPSIASSVVMGKLMFGWNPSYPFGTGAISSSDTLLTAIQKLNASVENIVTNPAGVSSVSLNVTPTTIFSSSTTPASGAVTLSATLKSQTANTFLAAPNGTNGVPSFRTISVDDIPALSPDPSGTYGGGSPLEIPIITVDAQGRVTAVATTTATGSGTVTSVNIDPPSYFVAGSPVTSAGDISLAWDTAISPNTVLAGPDSGVSTAAPTFRSLVALDIPTIAISQVGGLQNALDSKMDYALNDGEIYIGNAVNAPATHSLSGDVTMTRTGVVTIEPGVVDFAKMQDITSGNLLGRWDATTPGVIQEVGLSGDFILDNTTGILSLSSPTAPILDTKGSLLTYSQSVGQQVQLYASFDGKILITNSNLGEGLEWVDVTGDITLDTATPSGAATISAGAVTLAKMANLTADSFIGNNTGGGVPMELSVTDATAMLNIFSTTGTDKGLVPGSNGVASTYYLDASGNWSEPGGGGGGGTTTYALTMDNSGSGSASGSTFNGSSPITISYNSIGAPKTDGTNATGTWSISVTGNAGTVTNGLYSTGSYSNPTWLTSILGSIVSGNISGSAGSVANALTIGSGLSLNSGTTYNGSAARTITLNVANANTWSALQTFAGSSGIYIGEAGTASGVARFIGTTSGYVALKGPDTGDSKTYILPATNGSTGQFLQLSNSTTGELAWATGGGGGGMVIGDPITGATAGSVLFAGVAGVLAQENGDFFWDNTNKYLGIGTATPECGVHVVTSGSSNIKGIMNMHFDSNADNQAKFIGARARGSKGSPSALQANDRITSLSARGYKTSGWSDTVGGFYIYASEAWTNTATGTYLTFRGAVAGGTTVTEWGRLTSTSTLVQLALGQASAKSGALLLYSSGGASTTTIQASPSATTSETYVLPATDGASGQVIQTDGNGILSWVNNGAIWAAQNIKSTTATVYPANTAQGVFLSLLIPANTFGSGSIFKILTRISKSGGGSSSTLRAGFNTTNANLTGIIWIGIATTFGTSAVPGLNVRHISIESTSTSFYPSISAVWGSGTSSDIGFNPAGGNPSTVSTIDWTVNQYLIIAASTASTDTFTNNFISISPA